MVGPGLPESEEPQDCQHYDDKTDDINETIHGIYLGKSAVPGGAASSQANLLDYFLQGRGHCGAICWWAQRCC